MRLIAPALRWLPLGLLAACSAPTGPTEPARGATGGTLALDRGEVVLRAIGDSAAVTATMGAERTTTPTLTLVSESRHLNDAPVLDAAGLSRGSIRAVAPGSAILEVSAFGAAPVRLPVRFRPDRPLVVAAGAGAAGDGDTLRLRGFGLAGITAVTVGDARATVLGGDSANLLLTVPSMDAPDCATAMVPQGVRVEGADVAAGLAVTRRRRGDLRLAVGQSVRLDAASAHCLRLAAIPGARYALAFLDTRKTERARTGFEGYVSGPARYTVSISAAGTAAPSASASAGAASLTVATAPERRVSSTEGTERVFGRTTPWRAGDRFLAPDDATGGTIPARVVEVYANGLVFAVAEGQEAAGGMDAWTARADSAFRFFATHGYAAYRRTVAQTAPVTSAGSGQLLVLAARDNPAYMGFNTVDDNGGRPRSFTRINLAYGFTTSSSVLRVLAHEVAHAWQAQYAADTRPAGAGDWQTGIGWSLEGTADLLAWVVLGRYHGIDPSANWDWARGTSQPALAPYAQLAANTGDDFALGYASAASFGVDLALRMTREGASWDDAVSAVVQGSLDGWYGYSISGARRSGLAARVRSVLGAGWTPEDALLTWTLSQAIDDASGSTVFQNPSFLAAYQPGPASTQGWGAAAVLRSGGVASRVDPGSVATVAGNAATVSPTYGSPNYVLIEDNGVGGAYSLGATWNNAPLAQVAWALVRYQ
jgi:hypothetical protein